MDRYEIRLFAIYDNQLDTFVFPFVSTYDDICTYLSATINFSRSQRAKISEEEFNVPIYAKYPDDYSIYDCGSWRRECAVSDGNPFGILDRPRFLSRLSAFGGESHGEAKNS